MLVWVWDALKMLIEGIRQEGMTALLILLFVAAGIWILEALKKIVMAPERGSRLCRCCW